jgi:hypothetical protein
MYHSALDEVRCIGSGYLLALAALQFLAMNVYSKALNDPKAKPIYIHHSPVIKPASESSIDIGGSILCAAAPSYFSLSSYHNSIVVAGSCMQLLWSSRAFPGAPSYVGVTVFIELPTILLHF